MDQDRRQSPHITLIGMSNIGKSYWAERLAAEAGFEHIDCDALIEEKLADDLKATAGGDIAAWMGQPYEARYTDASRKYLAAETAVMQKIIERLRSVTTLTRPLVIDTSGSLIHLDKKTVQDLAALTRIIYLETSPEHVAELFRRYLEQPKPVIWGDVFTPRAGEQPTESLQRCYPLLLNERARRYAEIAKVKIPFDRHEDPHAGPELFA